MLLNNKKYFQKMSNEMLPVKKWDELSVKDKFSYGFAIASFVVGWGLVIASFSLSPAHEVDSSVLACLGSALVFCSACLGISYHYDAQLNNFKEEIRKRLEEQR